MGLLSVQVWDATGAKRQEVQMPDDAPINRILAVLLEKMNFPQYAPDGQPLSYKFHHRASGKQLLDSQTLGQVGVKDGDVLRLQPEITAGSTGCATAFRRIIAAKNLCCDNDPCGANKVHRRGTGFQPVRYARLLQKVLTSDAPCTG